MQNQKLDIVHLIEQNPVIQFSKENNCKLVTKIQQHFSESQQQIFISSFYCYLNYNSKTDFIINLNDIWKWLGFSRRDPCKVVLEKHFKRDIDYKIFTNTLSETIISPEVAGKKIDTNIFSERIIFPEFNEAGPSTDVFSEQFIAPEVAGANIDTNVLSEEVISRRLAGNKNNKETRGRKVEKILININTFKKLCLKSNTKKADEIHDYFIKLEEILQEVINEESVELKKLLQQKDLLLIEQKEQTELEKEILLEKTLLQQFPVNTQCIYIGKIDNLDANKCNLVSFGMSNDLNTRIKAHKKTYNNFRLSHVFKVKNHIEIENCIKKHPILKQKIRYLMINNINYREHLSINPDKHNPDFNLEKLYEYIKEIINENEYNIENYNKLISRCEELESQIRTLQNKNIKLENETKTLNDELTKYKPDNLVQKIDARTVKLETTIGYCLYAFYTNNPVTPDRYKIGICRKSNLISREKMFKFSHPNGELKLQVEIKHAFLEKALLFIMNKNLTMINKSTYDGSLNDIKVIFDIVSKIESLLINNDVEQSNNILNNKPIEKIEDIQHDPEIPYVKKSKRSVDQIDKDTGKIIATYESIEAAGRGLELKNGSGIGMALRNHYVSYGYLWKYSKVSNDDQMKEKKIFFNHV